MFAEVRQMPQTASVVRLYAPGNGWEKEKNEDRIW